MAADLQRLNGNNSIELLCYIWAGGFQMPHRRQALWSVLFTVSDYF